MELSKLPIVNSDSNLSAEIGDLKSSIMSEMGVRKDKLTAVEDRLATVEERVTAAMEDKLRNHREEVHKKTK